MSNDRTGAESSIDREFFERVVSPLGDPSGDHSREMAAQATGLPIDAIDWALTVRSVNTICLIDETLGLWTDEGFFGIDTTSGELQLGMNLGDAQYLSWAAVRDGYLFEADGEQLWCIDKKSLTAIWQVPCNDQVRVEEGVVLTLESGRGSLEMRGAYEMTVTAYGITTGAVRWSHSGWEVDLIGTLDGMSYISTRAGILAVSPDGQQAVVAERNDSGWGMIVGSMITQAGWILDLDAGQLRTLAADDLPSIPVTRFEDHGLCLAGDRERCELNRQHWQRFGPYEEERFRPIGMTQSGILWEEIYGRRVGIGTLDGPEQLFDFPFHPLLSIPEIQWAPSVPWVESSGWLFRTHGVVLVGIHPDSDRLMELNGAVELDANDEALFVMFRTADGPEWLVRLDLQRLVHALEQ